MNVFIFGGSFDPPHVAHVLAVAYLLSTMEPDRVLVVPVLEHPLGKEVTPFHHRVAMCERAMGRLPRTEISRVEEELGGESKTLRTVEHLRARHPDWNMRLVVGGDILLEEKRWHAFDRVVEIAPLLVLERAGFEAEGASEALLPDVSSTAVRDAIRAGRSAVVESLVPRAVLTYIEANGLYRGA